MSACVSTTEEPTTEIPTTTEEPTTEDSTTEEPINTSFVPVDSANVESDLVNFIVQINTTTIDGSNPVVTVVVEITAKITIDQELGTSSYGDEGIIGIRIISVDDDEISLYSEYYDIPVTDDIYNVHLDIDDSLTRTIQFARMPFHGGAGGELICPPGTYKVQVALFAPEMVWLDTDLIIVVA
ncbi:MAG: hypothetical protein JXR48_03655 [Candidatus Delongbacteria bacterium]|nr:hypothetical protein [Candidatus Delongbacteria bacterium]